MQNCPHCSVEIGQEVFNFCENCEKQVRCLNPDCRAFLIAGKSRCLVCGIEIGTKPQEVTKTKNTLKLEEQHSLEESSRKVEIEVSDEAIKEVGSYLGFFTQPTVAVPKQKIAAIGQKTLLETPRNHQKIIDVSIENSNQVESLEKISVEDVDVTEILHQIFKFEDDGRIIPLDVLYKGNFGSKVQTKKDKSRNMTLLYIFAYETQHQSRPTKEQIFQVMRDENLYDGNYRVDFTKIEREYLKLIEGGYTLHYTGKTKLNQIFEALINPNEESTPSRKSVLRPGRPKGSGNRAEIETVQSWLSMDAKVDAFDTRNLKSAREWGLFTLYLITKVLKVSTAVDPGVAYQYISTKYEIISIKRKAFRDAISSSRDHFSRNTSGAYSLTAKGEQDIVSVLVSSGISIV